jgi:hypothetical protein
MMFDEIWWLEHRRDKFHKEYDKDIKQAVKTKDYKKAEDLREVAAHDYSTAEYEIDSMKSCKLVKHAIRLKVPRPPFPDTESWEESSYYGHVLTDKGYDDLRSKIMAFQKATLEHSFRWWKEILIPLITLVLGILGTYLAMRRH